jgi:AcrR family transcriptional regulator
MSDFIKTGNVTKSTKSPLSKKSPKSTEEKIREAARKLFNKNGFHATRSRDIADAAGVNTALVNYHFQSKERLFEVIMLQTTFEFAESMIEVFDNPKTSFEQKIEISVSRYIDKFTEEPDMANFIMNEIRHNPAVLLEKMQYGDVIKNSTIVKQYNQAVAEGKINAENPIVFISNLLGLIVFPFLGKNILKKCLEVNEREFEELMEKRKQMIPGWIKSMFFTENNFTGNNEAIK